MSLIICKKCNGPHLTIKCGKEPKPIEDVPIYIETRKPYNYNDNKKSYSDKKKIMTVRLSNLPDDITVNELEKLIKPWGSIGRINISNFENKSGFIDFNFKNEADYFIEAIDRTPFDNLIVRAEYIENKY
jgi:hypothetical protein